MESSNLASSSDEIDSPTIISPTEMGAQRGSSSERQEIEDLDYCIRRRQPLSKLIRMGPWGKKAADKILGETILGDSNLESNWLRYTDYLNRNGNPPPFQVSTITDYMVEKVKNQQRPEVGLQQVAGMIHTISKLLGLNHGARQEQLQLYIKEYVRRHTLRPKETTGFINVIEVLKVIRKPLPQDEVGKEIRVRAIVATLLSAVTMWRGVSLVLMNQPNMPENDNTFVCAIPFSKRDTKRFDGRKLNFTDGSDPSISVRRWIQLYLMLSEETRMRHREKYPEGPLPLFVPLKGKPITDHYLTQQAIASGMKQILIEAEQSADEFGDKIYASSWRGSTQTRLRRLLVGEDYISIVGDWTGTIRQKFYDRYAPPPCWVDLCLAQSNIWIPQTPLPIEYPSTVPLRDDHIITFVEESANNTT